jgi:hypothetical protein
MPLVAVRWQWGQRIFSGGGDAVAGVGVGSVAVGEFSMIMGKVMVVNGFILALGAIIRGFTVPIEFSDRAR